eukprot:scaffold5207_cov96-Skeletonema_dohrnii-CCMP3373.AAC.5
MEVWRHFFDVGDDSEEDMSAHEDDWLADLQSIKDNDPDVTELAGKGHDNFIENMTDEGWEQLGRDISNNTHLTGLHLTEGALNDRKISFFFRGLTRSSTIKYMHLYENEFSVAGVQSMVLFVQNASNLTMLNLDANTFESEGFNALMRALRDSPIESLSCDRCGIESIDIDSEHIPKHLTHLYFSKNSINADGCRGLAKLLQGGDSTLNFLNLDDNKIDDEGVEILADALKHNRSLTTLTLRRNNDISRQGQIMLLKLISDISSIKATLQSNHTLKCIHLVNSDGFIEIDEGIMKEIEMATLINASYKNNPEGASRRKVIQTQLHSETRAALCHLQDVNHSVYSEIDPLHLPEVLALIDRHNGHEELYVALSSSIMTLFSTVNRKKCIQQQMEYHAAKVDEHRAQLEELGTELEAIEAAEGNADNDEVEHRSNKRRRKWWWGLWG